MECAAAVEGVPGLPAQKKSSGRTPFMAGMLGRAMPAGGANSPAGMPIGSEPTPAAQQGARAHCRRQRLAPFPG